MPQTKHLQVYGKTLSGKGYAIKRLFEKMKRGGAYLFAYNPMGDPELESICHGSVRTVDGLEAFLKDKSKRALKPHVMIDEMRRLNKQKKPKEHPETDCLLTDGRHRGYTIYACSQRPVNICPDDRSMFEQCLCFRLGLKIDAEAIVETYGVTHFMGKPLIKFLTKLPKYHSVFFDILDGGDTRVIYYDPSFKPLHEEIH